LILNLQRPIVTIHTNAKKTKVKGIDVKKRFFTFFFYFGHVFTFFNVYKIFI